MIGFIRGLVAASEENLVWLDCNGIGYELSVPKRTAAVLERGAETTLYTYLQVKEDGVALFGFSSMEEKKVFMQLLSVSGVGPKVAIAMLSSFDSAADLCRAILQGDTSDLCRVKGLGRKTAERVVLELRGKIAPSGAYMSRGPLPQPVQETSMSQEAQEVVQILVDMGVKRPDAILRVKKAIDAGIMDAQQMLAFTFRG